MLKTYPVRTWAVLALVIACAGHSLPGQGILLDGVAAHVNDHVITIGEVLPVIEPVRRQLVQKYAGEELQDKLRAAYDEALNSLIERQLIIDLSQSKGVALPDWLIDRRVDEIIREMFSGDRNELLQALSEDRMTYEEWRTEVEHQILVASMRDAQVGQNVAVSPGAVRDAYERNPEEYQVPAQVNLRMIVLRKNGGGEDVENMRRRVELIRNRLTVGEDFALLARDYSDGSKADEGGAWGWVEPKVLRREIQDALADLEAGRISPIIETDDGFYIVKAEGLREQSVVPFEEAQEEIERQLRYEQARLLYDAWMDRLRDEAYVRVFDVDLF